MTTVGNLLAFGEFKHNVLGGKLISFRRLQGGANTAFRLVDRIGQKVDTQYAVNTQLRGKRNGLNAALLVKEVAIFFGYMCYHHRSRLIMETSHQCFVAKYTLRLTLNNRLKCHGKIEVQRTLCRTLLADYSFAMF